MLTLALTHIAAFCAGWLLRSMVQAKKKTGEPLRAAILGGGGKAEE